MKKKILENNEEIKDYKFLLCLIYDNVPVKDIDEIARKDLEELMREGYIQEEFKLKIIYLIPNLGSYNLNNIQNDNKEIKINMDKIIEDLKKDMENQKRDMKKQKKEMEEYKQQQEK